MTNPDDLRAGRAAAGDKNVSVWGGANIMTQYLKAWSLDEMQIHLIPVLLGGGIRFFEDFDPEGNRTAEGQVRSRRRLLRTFGSTS